MRRTHRRGLGRLDAFFLECVGSARDGVGAAGRLFELLGKDRRAVVNHPASTVPAVRLLDLLPEHPMVTLSRAMDCSTTKPTAAKAIDALRQAGILRRSRASAATGSMPMAPT